MPGTFRGYCTYYKIGKITANGEAFNINDMTAAMTQEKARFGAMVKVSSDVSGKSIKVRINDRGPFKRGKNGKALHPLVPDDEIIIDLTPAVFRALTGGLSMGKVRVTVEVK